MIHPTLTCPMEVSGKALKTPTLDFLKWMGRTMQKGSPRCPYMDGMFCYWCLVKEKNGKERGKKLREAPTLSGEH